MVNPAMNEDAAESNGHAILLVQAGGRLNYLNGAARHWLGVREGESPNLDTIARRIQPADEFLKLCTAEGEMRFSVNGRPMEISSYHVPGMQASLLVSLRLPEASRLEPGTGNEFSGSVLKILTDLNQSIAASLGLSSTIQALLENIQRLVPADVLEIKLWDEESQKLSRFHLVSGINAELNLEQGAPEAPAGYSATLVSSRQNLFIPQTKIYNGNLPPDGEQATFTAYFGLPLLAGNDLVGTLEGGLTKSDTFKQEDLDLLQLIIGQAAAAIRNASKLEAERRRSAELSGLANLAQALGSTHEARELFTRLVQSLAPLFDVEVLGFLVYNENRRDLEAQVPFAGMPPQVVELYHVSLATGGLAEENFLKMIEMTTQNAMEDEKWLAMGFQDYARAASWRDSALIPLISSGHPLGYLQISNHKNKETAFSVEEMRLLNIVAHQAAPIIENVTLVQQARLRAQRSEALRRIANLTASSATINEILRYTVQELARLLQADVAAIFLFDETRGVLRLHSDSIFGVQGEASEPLFYLYVDEAQFHFTVTGSLRPFLSGHLSEDQRLLSVYKTLFEKLGMESGIIVPLSVREKGMGELLLTAKKTDFFNNYDLQVVSTAAGQLAPVIEGVANSVKTDEGLRLRSDRITEIVHVGRELNTSLDWQSILQILYDESLRFSRAECGSVLLFSPGMDDQEPMVVFRLGEEFSKSLLPAERSAWRSGEALLVSDHAESEFSPAHEGIRSSLIVPIVYKDQVSGLVHLHSLAEGGFSRDDLESIQILAVQAAIALGNARRYQEQTAALERSNQKARMLSSLFETVSNQPADQPLEVSLEALAHEIQQATPFQTVLISTVDQESMMQTLLTGVGLPVETLSARKDHQQPWELLTQLLRPEYKTGSGYFIPFDNRPMVPDDIQLDTVLEEPAEVQNTWNPEDSLFYPLYEDGGKPIGLISLDAPSTGQRPDEAVLEVLEIFASQAAIIIQSKRQMNEYRSQVETLSTSLDRQQQMLSISQGHLPTLLHKDLEQMISIRNLERRVRRIRAGLEITEVINRQVDGPSALEVLGREILARLDMSIAIVAENTIDGPSLLHVMGNIPHGTNPEALFGQRNPLRTCLQTGETLLVMNLEQEENWRDTPLLTSLHAKSFICLPIFVDEKPAAGILAISPEPMPSLTEEDRQTYYQISNQVSITLQNINLLTGTRRRLREVNLLLDFSRQLSGLDPESIVKALLESALRVVTTAHAGVVLLYDEGQERLRPQAVSGYADNADMMRILYQPGETLPGMVFKEQKSRRVDEVNFARDYSLPAEYLMLYREATAGRLPVSSMVIPIQTGEQILGVLLLDNFNTTSAFTTEDEALLLSLNQQVALSLENVRLFDETRRLADELEQRVVERTGELAREQRNTETLLRILTEASSSLDLERALNRTLALLNEAIGAEQGSIMMLNPEDNSIQYRAGYGYLTPATNDGKDSKALTVGDGLAGWVIRHREAVRIDDIRKDERWTKDASGAANHRSVVAAPLMVGEDVIGAILVFHREVGFFSPEATNLVQAIGNQVAVAINNAQLYNLIRDQAERLGSMLHSQQVEASRQQAIIEAVADGVLVTDPANTITFLNSSAGSILNLDGDQITGQSLDKFVGLFGKASQTWMQTIRDWSVDPSSHHPGDTYAESLSLESGKVVLVHLAPVIWRNEFLGTVSIFRDITHEVEVDRLKSEFVATVSHELRTPMTSIKGYVDILLMGAAGALNENQTHFLDIVRSNADRLSVLVNDLLDISRIEAGRVSLSFQALDMHEVANDVVTDTVRRSQEDNKPMEITLDISPDLPRVRGDIERVHQILSNLVDNSYNYTPAHGKIHIDIRPVEDEVQIDVIDNGIGIDPTDGERIFERFYRGEHPLVLATPGTGLGLAIVKQLVTMHKGRIWMTSKGIAGEGSTFSVSLPIFREEES